METNTPFAVEYHSETPELTDTLKEKVEQRLQKLAKRHHDITGASLSVDLQSHDDTSSYTTYRVRLVVYQRPENVAAVREEDSVAAALKEVLDAVERQVRERRERQRERHRARRS
ncbi:MAG TPA: ribosome-associated translation inhibitor RaiA [Rhodothermales bacterium]|nr:ribosome-associated translation inhibitor RaiA [Rhodothermales bacterium]